MKKILHIFIGMTALLLQSSLLQAQAGQLDNSFNGNGIKIVPNSGYGMASDVTVQSDGKTILVGRLDEYNGNSQYPFTIVRLNQDGSNDMSFGNNGVARVNIYNNQYNNNYYYSEARSVTVQSDGKIVVAGNAYNQDYYYNYGYNVFTVIRLNSDGSIDNTFGGGDGIVQYNPSNNSNGADVTDMAIQSDGKILVSGSAYDYTYNYYGYTSWSYALVRFNADGSHDNTYNNGTGIFRHSFDQGNYYNYNYGYYYYPYAFCQDIALTNDGKVVMNGVVRSYDDQYNYYYYDQYYYGVVRVNTNGTLDLSFNGTGSVKLAVFPANQNYYSYSEGRGIAVQADNKIIVSGYGYDYNNGGNTFDYYVAGVFRLNTDGSRDASFNGNGQKNFSLRRGDLTNTNQYNNYTYSYPYSVLIQNDQKILIGGTSEGQLYDPQYGNIYRQTFSLARLNTNGSLDNTFSVDQTGVNSYNLYPNNNNNNYSYAWSESMAKAPDGRVVMAGRSYDYTIGDRMTAIRVLVNNDCPASVTINAAANACNAVVNGIASHFELKEGETLVSVSYVINGVTTGSGEGDASGTTFNSGTSYITYTGTILGADEQTFQRQCTFTVTVKDVTPPTMVCLPEIRVSVQPGNDYVLLSSLTAPTATDLCGTATVSNNNGYPYLFAGDNYINWIATDASGNTTTCTQKVVVVLDNEPPVITCPAPIVVSAAAECATIVNYAATATDNSGSATITYSIQPGTSFNKGVTTVTVTATDAVGNSSTCSFTVTVTDNIAPSFSSTPADLVVSNDNGVCGASRVLTAPTATDNCSVASITNNAPAVFPVGTTVVTWTATDVNGNTSTLTQNVTVNDTEAPVAKCQPVTVQLQNGVAQITAADINNVSTDNCGIATMVLSKTSFSCSEIGVHNVTMTVTDVNGNQSTCTTQVTVTGSIPSATITAVPSSNVYTGGVPTNIYLGYGAQTVTLAVNAVNGAPYTYQWTGNGSLSNTNTANPVFAPTAAGNYTFTVLVTNANGCVTTATISICVRDIRVPGTAGKKVYVCHVPPGNNNNPQTLEISVNAVSAHIGAHSQDRLGSCNTQGCAVVTNAPQAVTQKAQVLTESTANTDEAFKVVVMPNPSMDVFTLKLESKLQAPIQMRITDAAGRAMESRANIAPNSTFRVGSSFLSGTYYAEFIQGNQRKVVQLIKVKR